MILLFIWGQWNPVRSDGRQHLQEAAFIPHSPRCLPGHCPALPTSNHTHTAVGPCTPISARNQAMSAMGIRARWFLPSEMFKFCHPPSQGRCSEAGWFLQRDVNSMYFYNKRPTLMQGHHRGPGRKFLMRQNLETVLIYTWWFCNLWTRLSPPFSEQDDNLEINCFLLLQQRGLIALLAWAHKVTRNTYPPRPGASGETNSAKQKEGFGSVSRPLPR